MKLQTPQHTQEARPAAEAPVVGKRSMEAATAMCVGGHVALEADVPNEAMLAEFIPNAALPVVAAELAPVFLGRSYPGASVSAVKDNSRELDLGSVEAAIAWADENGVSFFDEVDPSDPYAAIQEEFRKELISDYCAKFSEVMKHETVRIYRDVMLARIEDFDPIAAGIYWSFESICTTTVGAMDHDNWMRFKIVADLKTADINWEEGLRNFINYPEQWECNVKLGAPISIQSVLPWNRPTVPPGGYPKHWLGIN